MGFVPEQCIECGYHYDWDMYEDSDCPECGEPLRCSECGLPAFREYLVESPTGDLYTKYRVACQGCWALEDIDEWM